LVNVPEPVGFIEDDEVPAGQGEVIGLLGTELVRSDDNMVVDLEGPLVSLLRALAVALRFENSRRKAEFVEQFLYPLLS
jgi:hypothetical protein